MHMEAEETHENEEGHMKMWWDTQECGRVEKHEGAGVKGHMGRQ